MSVQLFPEGMQEQRLMAESAIRIMEATCPLSAAREEHGGVSLSGIGVADAAILAAERGPRLQPGPFVGTQVVVGTLARAGTRHWSGKVS